MKKSKNIVTASCLLVLLGGSTSVFASHGNLFSMASNPEITAEKIIDVLGINAADLVPMGYLVELLKGCNPETGHTPSDCLTPFHLAAFDGNGVSFLRAVAEILPLEGVITLLQMRSRGCKTDKYGNTPVHLAAKRSNGEDFIALMGEMFTKDLLMELLGMPGRLNYLPLHTAIESGNGDAFLRAEAKILEDDKDLLMELLQKRSLGGKTPLHEAAYVGGKSVKFVRTVAQIFGEEKFIALLGEVDDCGNTPIFEATIRHSEAFLDAVSRLLPSQFYITSRCCIRCKPI
ncbi:MAG: hypothetical protein LBF34_00935 [Puniceicoccales bacterium]|nr:hypothetical protein [Puniceicoccales bacterium]